MNKTQITQLVEALDKPFDNQDILQSNAEIANDYGIPSLVEFACKHRNSNLDTFGIVNSYLAQYEHKFMSKYVRRITLPNILGHLTAAL